MLILLLSLLASLMIEREWRCLGPVASASFMLCWRVAPMGLPSRSSTSSFVNFFSASSSSRDYFVSLYLREGLSLPMATTLPVATTYWLVFLDGFKWFYGGLFNLEFLSVTASD